MMATDLKKMVEDWQNMDMNDLRKILLEMAAEIEANREEIKRLKVEVDRLKWVNDPNL